MSKQFIVREATKEDVPAILDLVRSLALYERAPEEVTVTLEHFAESGFGDNPVWWALVVEDKHQGIVGMALYYIRFSTWKGQTMYLEDFIVDERYRQNGVGTAVIDRLIDVARSKGFNRINWQVLEWNDLAIDFYKRYNTHFDDEWINCHINI